MKRWLGWTVGVVLVGMAGVYVANASWRVAPPDDPSIGLIAHRGVHQTYSSQGLDNDTCTAERIDRPTHILLENTLASMRAAFAAGADIVEIDVHPTTDGRLAVFHDWTIDCRTEGSGVTREQDLASLQSLDIGFGYTADGGESYPFRGTGTGLMPSLEEVLTGLPDGQFLVNFKSNEAREAMMVTDLAERTGATRAIWGAYGGAPPTLAMMESMPGRHGWTRSSMLDCLLGYASLGWTGFMPDPCRNATLMVPVNLAGWLWGWPNLFLERMQAANSTVILIGPYGGGDVGTTGIDDLDTLARVPESFSGYLWTNRIEVIGPALGREMPLSEEMRFSPPGAP